MEATDTTTQPDPREGAKALAMFRRIGPEMVTKYYSLIVRNMAFYGLTSFAEFENELLNNAGHNKADLIIKYCQKVKKGRWKEGEKVLMEDKTAWQRYKNEILDKYGVAEVGADQDNLEHDVGVLLDMLD